MMIGLSSIGASCSPSQLTSPPNYSNIGGPTTFTWTPTDPSCVNWVKLMVGSGPRSSDLFQSSALQNYGDAPTSATVQVPTDGRMIYVSLVSAINFNPIYQDYVFMAIPPAAPRIPDPTPAVTVAAPVVSPPPAQTNTAVLPHVSVDVLPVITVGNSGAPVNVPPSADTQLAVPSAPPPSTQTTTVSPGAGTSAPPPASSTTTSTSGTTSTSSTTPAAATDDGTIFGIPTTYALIGAAAVLFLMMGKK